ncbi:phosphoadenylyl-sulfate reductase [Stackebrandtia nassauensis]|uniref:Adenosine 5'-phosphosulfate reductase n=1 Tax=Stackebrandtia nassauensis (strain DSM 44728 / CIP 108903 / NRRL B-16338 / NBRC 102104 / LLR-40K-21) TaxID=446470 RepID=D3QBR1_STANL|nr:phosphoadenylyl-sulfate reductase [Stackebrandtia nassauensis]ADD44800.1 phosphoadenosine phosphosulfate reductase [Stackebrandtia nassauensis DSM 44728]
MTRDPFELRDMAIQAGRDLEDATAERIIEWAIQEFGDKFCVTSSFQDTVLTHLASKVAPGVDVVFLDTGLHFQETLDVRERVVKQLPVHVRSINPELSVGRQDGEYGTRLWERAPNECCHMRKVAPLDNALADYDAWAAGLRRDEGPTRANTKVVDFDAGRKKVKISPIARWTQAEVEAYIKDNNLPTNELLDDGYMSVGCWPCTRRTAPGEDPRAGRWAMFDKTECGLHV